MKDELSQLREENEQVRELNGVLIDQFNKARVLGSKVMSADHEDPAIQAYHQEFLNSFEIGQIIEDMMKMNKSVNDIIGYYLLGAKNKSEKIILEAEKEALRIIKEAQETSANQQREQQSLLNVLSKEPIAVEMPDRYREGPEACLPKLTVLKSELALVLEQLGEQVDEAFNSIETYIVPVND